MSLSPFDSFQSRFVTYLLNFPRNISSSTMSTKKSDFHGVIKTVW